MVNQKRNFQADLLHELKWFTHCKIKKKNPNHYCYTSELAKNLKISHRDVAPNLEQMVKNGMIDHHYYKFKGRERHGFVPLDKSRYGDEDKFNTIELGLKTHFSIMRRVAQVMRDRPSTHSIKMIPLTKEQGANMISRSYTGKTDKVGKEALVSFCDEVNDIFSYIDSLSYSTLDDTITPNGKTEKRILELRKYALEEITEMIDYTIERLGARQTSAIKQDILMRIPTYYMLTQLRKMSKVMI